MGRRLGSSRREHRRRTLDAATRPRDGRVGQGPVRRRPRCGGTVPARDRAPPLVTARPSPVALADVNGREADPERSRRPSPKAFHVAFPRRASWMRSPTPPDAHARPPASWAPLAVPDAGVTASSADSAPPPFGCLSSRRSPRPGAAASRGGGLARDAPPRRVARGPVERREMRRRSALRARATRRRGRRRRGRTASTETRARRRERRLRGEENDRRARSGIRTDAVGIRTGGDGRGRVLRLGENARAGREREGEANDDSRGVSPAGATNRSSDDDLGDVWARHADGIPRRRRRVPPRSRRRGGAARRRGDGRGRDADVRGEAAVEAAALARDADEHSDAAGRRRRRRKEKCRKRREGDPRGEFRDERRGDQRPGKGLPSAREDHTRERRT